MGGQREILITFYLLESDGLILRKLEGLAMCLSSSLTYIFYDIKSDQTGMNISCSSGLILIFSTMYELNGKKTFLWIKRSTFQVLALFSTNYKQN